MATACAAARGGAPRAKAGSRAPRLSPAALPRREALLGGGAALVGLEALLGEEARAAASPSGTVVVVGATGQTGRRVVAQLRARGVAVRAAARDTKKAASLGLALTGADLVQADVLDVASLDDALRGAEALVVTTGFTPSLNLGKDNPSKVDQSGTVNLVDAAKRAGVNKVVLVSSLLTNAVAVGQKDNDNYKFLNAFGGVLDAKLAAEKYLRASGIDYTVVRPGGLSNEPPDAVGNLIVSGEDTLFGLPTDPGREISRDTVAAVCVEALYQPAASDKVVEIVSSPSAPVLPADKWFA